MVDFSIIGAEQSGMVEGEVHTGAWGSANNGNMNNRTSFNRRVLLKLANSGVRRAGFGAQGDYDSSWSTSNEQLVFRDSNGNPIFALDVDSNERFRAVHFPGGVRTLLDGAYTNTQLGGANDTYAHFQLDMDTGVVKLYINNVLDTQWTGVDFSSFSDVREMEINGQLMFYMSGWWANDGEDITQWLVESAWPTADGADTDGVGTFADVDESSYSAADYITLAANERRSFVVSNRTLPYSKHSVSTAVIARRTATGPTQIRAYLLIGGVRYYGTAKTLSEQAQTFMEVWNQNPATGLDWVKADVEGAGVFEPGWEAVP